MRHLFLAGFGLLLLGSWVATVPGLTEKPAAPLGPASPETGPNEVCATGCAAAPTQDSDLSADEFRELIAAYASEPLLPGSPALEALLFYGASARQWSDQLGLEPLDAEHTQFLRAELERTFASLSVRIVGPEGRERVRLTGARVPLGEKQHLFPEHTVDLQVPEISGTVRRVGLNHLWTRL